MSFKDADGAWADDPAKGTADWFGGLEYDQRSQVSENRQDHRDWGKRKLVVPANRSLEWGNKAGESNQANEEFGQAESVERT